MVFIWKETKWTKKKFKGRESKRYNYVNLCKFYKNKLFLSFHSLHSVFFSALKKLLQVPCWELSTLLLRRPKQRRPCLLPLRFSFSFTSSWTSTPFSLDFFVIFFQLLAQYKCHVHDFSKCDQNINVDFSFTLDRFHLFLLCLLQHFFYFPFTSTRLLLLYFLTFTTYVIEISR